MNRRKSGNVFYIDIKLHLSMTLTNRPTDQMIYILDAHWYIRSNRNWNVSDGHTDGYLELYSSFAKQKVFSVL